MLTIILGIIATIIFCGILIFIDLRFTNSNSGHTIATLGAIGIILSLYLGLACPLSGYNEWEFVEETELVSLSNSTLSGGTGLIYVSLSANNFYTYRHEIDSELGTSTSKEYTTATVSGNIEEIEDPNCEIAVIRKYVRTAKKSKWTFALGYDETKYVFYVPEGSISKNVTLE